MSFGIFFCYSDHIMHDLLIIGGGPAGAAAAIYAARKQLKAVLVLKEWGGQSTVSEDIQNWIGTPHISGAKLAESLKNHVKEYESQFLSIVEGVYITDIKKEGHLFVATDEAGTAHIAKTVLITTGSARRKLNIPGADIFEHKGITYCASCDGPLFADQDVVVIGGGNAGFETAAQLLAYCKSVTLLNRTETIKADEITVKKVTSHPNMKLVMNALPKEIIGEKFVTGMTYTDSKTGTVIELATTGVFVEIGQIPATGFAKHIVELNQIGQIVIDPWTQRSVTPGIWAAGDCTNVLYHQNNIATGDAVRAIEDIYLFLHTQ